MFVCNCPDSLIRTANFKHIHLFAWFTFHAVEDTPRKVYTRNQTRIVIQHLYMKNYMTIRNSVTLLYLEEVQTQLLNLANPLELYMDSDTLRYIRSYITSVMTLIKARQYQGNSHFPATTKEPLNKLLRSQHSFFSTKKESINCVNN